MATDLAPVYQAAGREWNVDPALLQAVAGQETGGSASPNTAVSPKGAVGRMQLMPGTGQDMGVTDPNDPVQSIYGGAKYLSQMLDRYKSPNLAVAAYNAGPQRVDDYLAGKGPLPNETLAYVPSVTQRYQAIKTPATPTPVAQPAADDPFTAALKSAQQPGTAPASADPFSQALTAAQKAATPVPATPLAEPTAPGNGHWSDAGTNEYGIATTPNEGPNAPIGPGAIGDAPIANIVNAGIQGAKEGFGPGPVGMSPQTDQALVNAGVLNGPNGYNPLKAINRAIVTPLAAAGDLALRTGGALVGAYQHGVVQAGQEVGAPLLGRDLAALPEAFPAGDAGGGMAIPHPGGALAASPLVREISPAAHDALDTFGTPISVPYRTAAPATPASVLTQTANNPLAAAANDRAWNPLTRTVDPYNTPSFVPPGTTVPPPVVEATRPAFVPPAATPEAPPTAAPTTPAGPSASIMIKGQTGPAVNMLQSNGRKSPTQAVNDVNPLMSTPANDAEAYPAWNASRAQAPVQEQPAAPTSAAPTPSAAVATPARTTPHVPPEMARPEPAPAVAPVPQSVGAAASRDMTAPEVITAKTPEQKLTDLAKDVTQSAEDRAGPQMEDHATYVPGVERPLAARVFTPQNSLDDKTLRATDPVYRAEQEGIERNNNQTMVDLLSNDAGDDNALKVAHDERAEVAPPAQQLFAGEKPVDAAPLVKQIDDALAGPAGKRAAVVRTLTAVKNSLFDADGNLETMPSQLYGARQNITDLLKKGVGEGADDVRASKSFLGGLLDKMDPIINDGAPKYQAYLDRFHEASQPINQMEFLQKYQTGTKKLANVNGYLQLNKVQKMLDDIYQGQKAKGINPAKSLTDDQVQNIVNVRNELAAQSLKDRLAAVKGSDTTQQTNRAGILGDGPLGAAIKGGAELGAHALLFHTTGGLGNAVMALHRGVVKPSREAAKAARQENALVARKAELLNTQPNPLQTP